jgi:integrase
VGNVEKRGRRWSIRYRDAAGTQVRESGFLTRRDAEIALMARTTQIQRGSFLRPSDTTVAQYFESWLDGLPTSGRRPTTIAAYRRLIHGHVLPELGAIPLQRLTALDLNRLYSRLATSGRRGGAGGLKLRTVRFVHSVISKALSDAEKADLVVRNVARLASPPGSAATKAPEFPTWTPEQTARFLEFTRHHPQAALFRVAAMTGLRRGELCGLRWSDLELDAATLRVSQAIITVEGRAEAGPVKSHRSRRVLGLDPETVAVLRRHRREQLQHRLLVGPGWRDSDAVFANPLSGDPLHPDTITGMFQDELARSGLPKIRLHDLRHGHASHLLAAGVNARVVSDRLGHSTVAFTLDTYAHAMPTDQHEAAAAVAALVDRVPREP